MTKRADELALKVLKLEEKSYSDPAELEEREKRDLHIIIFGIPEFESEDVEKRRQHDIWASKNYFRFLGFEDVTIVNVERVDNKGDKPQIKVTLESPHIQRKILIENNKAVRHEWPDQIRLQLRSSFGRSLHTFSILSVSCVTCVVSSVKVQRPASLFYLIFL